MRGHRLPRGTVRMGLDSYQKLLHTLNRIKNGDSQAREHLIAEYKPFILRTARQLCKKPLVWGRDDELSISLIAFNSAIDGFDLDRQMPFLPFARMVIASRLKDYFRQESRHHNTCPLETELDDGTPFSPGVIEAAREAYRNQTIEDERQEELEHFESVLSSYHITFEDLVKTSPRHRDSRLTLFRVARVLASDALLMEYVQRRKQLPIKELMERTGVNRKTLERGRKFIIATALIASRPEEFTYLRFYINLESTGEREGYHVQEAGASCENPG